MQNVAQGGTITLRVTYQYSSGQLIDPTEHYLDITAPDGSLVVDNGQPVQDDTGQYSYVFQVPPLADLGIYTVRWFGTYNGTKVSSSEQIEVVAAGALTTADIVTRLRRLIGERIPIGKTEVDTRFLDSEIASVYYINAENMDKALSELWLAKAAYLGDFVDITESGTTRQLSQMQRAAMTQATKYEARVQSYENAWAATYRATPQTFNPWRRGCGRSRIAGTLVIFADPQRAW